jgi:hypothetical protein
MEARGPVFVERTQRDPRARGTPPQSAERDQPHAIMPFELTVGGGRGGGEGRARSLADPSYNSSYKL